MAKSHRYGWSCLDTKKSQWNSFAPQSKSLLQCCLTSSCWYLKPSLGRWKNAQPSSNKSHLRILFSRAQRCPAITITLSRASCSPGKYTLSSLGHWLVVPQIFLPVGKHNCKRARDNISHSCVAAYGQRWLPPLWPWNQSLEISWF